MQKKTLMSGVAMISLTLSPAFGANLADADFPPAQSCAVSGLNGKIDASGGYFDSDDNDGGSYRVGGSITAPVGCGYGVQLDGQAGELGGADTYSAAAHIFRRDPSSYLAGLYGEVGSVGGNDLFRIGAEAEKYFDDATLSFVAGYEDSQRTSGDVFGAVRLGYYVTDNFQVHVGGGHFLNVTAATAGFEYQTDFSSVALFADAAVGSNDHKSITAGLRYYFGPEKSLKRRHREDDPIKWLNVLESVTKQSTPAAAATGPCPPGQSYVPDGEGGGSCQPNPT